MDSFCQDVRFFFEHPLGVNAFPHQVAAICFRKWSDFVSTFGYPMNVATDPVFPPRLQRDLPFRRFVEHWYKHLEEMYTGNCHSEGRIPAGNDMLRKVLMNLTQLAQA